MPSGTTGTGLSVTIGGFMRAIGLTAISSSSSSQRYSAWSCLYRVEAVAADRLGQQFGDERLQVGTGRLLELTPAGLVEGGELADADQVAGHGAIGKASEDPRHGGEERMPSISGVLWA
jgi:hypothetical protein